MRFDGNVIQKLIQTVVYKRPVTVVSLKETILSMSEAVTMSKCHVFVTIRVSSGVD